MDYLAKLVEVFGLEKKVQEANEQVVDRHVIISFPSDQFDRNYDLICTLQEGETQLIGVIELDEGALDLLQILYLCPVITKSSFSSATKRAVQLINKVSPLPGFGFDEVDDRIFFRYALPLTERTCSTALLENTLAAVQQIIDLYIPLLEDISQGKQDINELIDEASDEFVDTYESMINKLEKK